MILIEENPNCQPVDGLVFQPRSTFREVSHVCREKSGEAVFCEVSGMDGDGQFIPARACLIDDSGEGACYLVLGGDWGLRLRDASGQEWGESYLLVSGDGSDLRFR